LGGRAGQPFSSGSPTLWSRPVRGLGQASRDRMNLGVGGGSPGKGRRGLGLTRAWGVGRGQTLALILVQAKECKGGCMHRPHP
jgi:hypothetical protein